MNSCVRCSQLTVSTEKIFLDVNNPRFSFPISTKGRHPLNARSQELARRLLMRKHGAKNVFESIKRLGFLTVDRVIVQKKMNDAYVVVEGNRRIAALKTLKRHARLGIEPLANNVLQSIKKIEVLVLEASKEDIESTALMLQGVRHISGVRSWGPYQQGRLVYSLMKSGNMTFKEAALSVGLSPSRVSTLLRGYLCLNKMMNHPQYCEKASPDMFSYFEHAFLKLPVRNWLGWDNEDNSFANKKNLTLFYSLITSPGPGIPPKLLARDVRDRLPEVLQHPKAKEKFCSGELDIQQAYRLTRSHGDILDPFLKSASSFLKEANELRLEINQNDRKLIQQMHEYLGQLLKDQPAL